MQIVERTDRTITIDGIVDADIRARNFKGEEKRHPLTGQIVNGQGRRKFLLYHLPDDVIQELVARGCEVKYTKVQNPNDIPTPFVEINVSYYLKPVDAFIRKPNNTYNPIDESRIYMFDDYDFSNMCIKLDFGRPKVHKNTNIEYTPIFAQTIVVMITPNYINEIYLNQMNVAPLPFQA